MQTARSAKAERAKFSNRMASERFMRSLWQAQSLRSR
jgi:hypothetical protein